MKCSEKKALFSFLTIYTLSSLFLISIIAFLYYKKAVSETKLSCKRDLINTLLSVEMDLANSYMHKKPFIFEPKKYKLHVALLTGDKKIKYSNLRFSNISLDKKLDMKKSRVIMSKELKKPILDIKYIVAEDIRVPKQLQKLKKLIAITMFVSLLFVAFIGYLLSRLLLKPVKEQVRELNRFIKDATHEINTPVTALLMSVSKLKKQDIKEKKLLQHISISAKQIANIYNTLSHISFSSSSQNSPKELNLKDEVQKSIFFFEEIAKAKEIKLISNLEDCFIMMDLDSVKKVINNFLSNAIKYSPNKSVVKITIKECTLYVIDEGIGIEKKDLELILKRYTRVSEVGGGFGIGLDIVNSICKKYGLVLDIKSTPKKGSAFSVDFGKVNIRR